MPLQLYYRPSFKRSLKRFGSEQRKITALILEALGIYCSSGCDLLKAKKVAPRFFYKQLRKPYHEAGVERNLRVLIRRDDQKRIAILAGNQIPIPKAKPDITCKSFKI